jgi:hypothetical protein
MSMSAAENRKEAASIAPMQRSAVTNGRRPFVDGDGNSAWTRRYADLVRGHVADLGGGDVLSEAEIGLIKRASTLEVELERMEGKLSKGEQIDLDLYGRSLNTLRRTLESLGLKRVARDVTPDLRTYLASSEAQP